MSAPLLENPSAPYSQEAEEATLGAALIDPAALVEIAALLNPEDFFMLRHQYIFQAFLRLSERQQQMDVLLVAEELANMGQLENIGGRVYLTKLINNTPNSLYGAIYAEIVQRAAIRRRMLEAADTIRTVALDEEKALDVVLAAASAALEIVLNSRKQDENTSPIWEVVSEYFDELGVRVRGDSSTGLPGGFRDVDTLMGGYARSDFILIAARPGVGKSAYMAQMALNMASKFGLRVAFFTIEMTKKQIVERMLSSESGVNIQKLRTGRLSPQEYHRAVGAMGTLGELPILLDDSSVLTPEKLRRKLKLAQYRYGLDAVFIDYIQLMKGGGKFNSRELEIGHISRSLKELAKELNIPVFGAAQLNRNLENRKDKRPQLADLRESGSLEQDTDVVQFLYRDELYNEATEFPNQADVIVAKHRNGPTGSVSLYFEKTLTKFMDATTHRVELGDL